MHIRYDTEVDALSITFRETTVTTQELAEGIAGEYDTDGKLVGLEILDASKRFGDPSTFRQIVLEGIGPRGSARSATSLIQRDFSGVTIMPTKTPEVPSHL